MATNEFALDKLASRFLAIVAIGAAACSHGPGRPQPAVAVESTNAGMSELEPPSSGDFMAAYRLKIADPAYISMLRSHSISALQQDNFAGEKEV